jgi:hypothetical protein
MQQTDLSNVDIKVNVEIDLDFDLLVGVFK